MRAPGREDPMKDKVDAVAFSGHFTIKPRLKDTDGMMLALHIREEEQRSEPCPWHVAGCGTVVVAREAMTTSKYYDVWVLMINGWLAAHGYELGGFVCFRGREPGDEGIVAYDARLILMRL